MKVNTVLCLALALALVTGAVALAQMHIQTVPAEGYTPDTLIIQRATPDYARVCVEPLRGGLLVCRTVKEVRRWAEDRFAK